MLEIRIEGAEQTFRCGPRDTLLRAALRAGLGFPYECNVGACGTCKFELLDGTVEELRPEAPGLSARERSKRKRLGCQSSPAGGCTIRVRLDEAYVPKIRPTGADVAFVRSRDLTHDMRKFHFQGRSADFLPGQYALMNLPGVTGARAQVQGELRWHCWIDRNGTTWRGTPTGLPST